MARQIIDGQHEDITDTARSWRSWSAEAQSSTNGIVIGLKLVLSFIGVLTLASGGVDVMNVIRLGDRAHA